MRLNIAWTFVGNAVYAACLWGVISALSKLGSAADVGRFALASAVATPVLQLANLQLRSIVASDSRRTYAAGDYLALRLLLTPLPVAAAAALAYGLYGPAAAVTVVLVAAGKAVESAGDLYYGFAQARERLDLVARSLMLKGAASLAVFVAVYARTRSLDAALAGLAAAWVVCLVLYDLPRMGRGDDGVPIRPRWRRRALASLAWLALPMGVVMLLIQLQTTIPRTLLEASRGVDELGVFAALSYVIVVGNTVVAAVSQSSLARLSRLFAAGDAAGSRRLVLRLVAVGAALGAAGVAFARFLGAPFLTLAYGPEYAGHGALFQVIMLAGGVLYVGSLLGAPATAMRAFRTQLVIHGANAVVLAVAGRALIPEHGMLGAAWTLVASALWVTAAYGWVVARGIRRLEPAAAR